MHTVSCQGTASAYSPETDVLLYIYISTQNFESTPKCTAVYIAIRPFWRYEREERDDSVTLVMVNLVVR